MISNPTWSRLAARFPGLAAILPAFIFSRIAFFLAMLFGAWLIPEAVNEPARVEINGNAFLALHWRWDAIHYYHISTSGYNPDGLLAFFPLFPLLVRATAFLLGGLAAPAPVAIAESGNTPLLAGILVAQAATLAASWLLFTLVREETGDHTLAQRATLYLLSFPLAFYYNVPYTESLYVALSIGMFLLVARRRWLGAGVLAAAATATRPFGMVLVAAFAVEMAVAWRTERQWAPKEWLHAGAGLVIAPLGTLLYMAFLYLQFGDPLAFVHIEAAWHHVQQLPYETLLQGIAYALHPSWSTAPDIYGRGVLNLVLLLTFLLVTLLSLRRWHAGYTVYALLLFAFIMSAPQSDERVMHALGRYVMVLFPVYITFAHWGRSRIVDRAILLLWLPLQGLLTALWVSWYPVA